MNILDLKRKAQSFHYRESQEGEGRPDWESLGLGLGFNSPDQYKQYLANGGDGNTLANVGINGTQYQNYRNGKLESDQIFQQQHGGGGLSGIVQGISDAVSTDDFRKAAAIAAAGYGAYNLYDAYAGAGALTDAGAGAGIVDGVGTTAANAFPEQGLISTVGGPATGVDAANFYDYGELGNLPGIATQTQNPSWMEKLSGYLPQVTSAAKTVGTGLDYAQKGMGLYSLYNKYNNANNNAAVANQIQGNSSQIANNDKAIQDQINGINEQIGKIPTLESLYGTDSAYAKNLMKQLAAKDAAAGRNSQYGPRLQEFNGKLATVAGDYANKYAQQVGSLNNSIAGLYRERTGASTALTNNAKAIADLNNNSNINKAQSLSSLYNEYKNSGISDALKNWFNSDSGE